MTRNVNIKSSSSNRFSRRLGSVQISKQCISYRVKLDDKEACSSGQKGSQRIVARSNFVKRSPPEKFHTNDQSQCLPAAENVLFQPSLHFQKLINSALFNGKNLGQIYSSLYLISKYSQHAFIPMIILLTYENKLYPAKPYF